MFKVYKTRVGHYSVINSLNGEVVGVYTTSRFATSVAALHNLQAKV